MRETQKNRIKRRLQRHRAMLAARPEADVAAQVSRDLLVDSLAELSSETLQSLSGGMLLFERDAGALEAYRVEGLEWDQIPFSASVDLSFEQIAGIGEHCYDVLLSNLVFDWVDAGEFIHLLNSFLADDGRFWFSCFGAGTASTTRSILTGLDSNTHFNDFYELQDVGDALFSAGFKDVSVSSTEFKLEYTSFEVLMADAHRIFSLNMNSQGGAAVYGRATYRAFKARVEAEIREQGVFTEHIEIMVAHGRKASAADQNREIAVRVGRVD